MSKLKKVQGYLEAHMAPVAGKIGEQRHIKAVTSGFMATAPLTILGGFALIIAQPPVSLNMTESSNFFLKILVMWKMWAVENASVLMTPYNMTMGLIGLYTSLVIAFFLLKSYEMDLIGGTLISGITFLTVAAPATAIDPSKPTSLFLSTGYLDAKGMFTGILVAVLTVEITRFLMEKNIKIKLPDSVPPMVTAPFEAIIPLIVNVVLFLSLNSILMNITGLNIPQAILKLFTPLVSASDSLPAVIITLTIINVLWFFGIHGGIVVKSVLGPFITMTIAANAAAVAAGLEPEYVFTGNFVQMFGNIGGAGGAFGMVMAILIVAKSTHLKSVGKLGFIPNIFGISEPLVFSTPMIMNPYLLIPMIIVPILNGTIAYLAISTGIVGNLYVNAPWTTPGVILAFISTMDWKASVLWILLATMSTIIYVPFVRAYDHALLLKEEGSE